MYASTEQRNRERVQVLAEQLYRDHHGRLLAVARRNAANEADAAEALHDGFVSFIEHFDPAGEAPALPWVTLTVKRRCWALYREAHLDRSAGQEVAPGSEGSGFSLAGIPTKTAGPEEAIERAEYVFEARERLASLKPAERTALLLFGYGYSYCEIGEIAGWTYTKVNRAISEGRAALRAAAPAASA
jgi:RNA polymerase sigma factor (sigma-70 family)